MSPGAIQLSPADFPGYVEAVARENNVRAAACLGLTERICGVEVLPLTARMVRLLAVCNSPHLMRSIKPEVLATRPGIHADAVAFLWIVSPKFKAGNLKARARFLKSIRHVYKLPMDVVCKEIAEYLDEAYLDAGHPDITEKSYYAFEISIVNGLHRAWGLPVDFWENHWLRNLIRRFSGKPCPLDVPLKIIWQNQKEQARHANAQTTLSNESDKKLADGLAALNQKMKDQTDGNK